MDVEAFHSFERISAQEQIHGVEIAAQSIVRIRLFLAEHQGRLELECAKKDTDREIIKHLIDAIKALEEELEGALAFLEEFDPLLYQKMKDNS